MEIYSKEKRTSLTHTPKRNETGHGGLFFLLYYIYSITILSFSVFLLLLLQFIQIKYLNISKNKKNVGQNKNLRSLKIKKN